jgi:6-phosphogluconolactonase (cycloisomerase 2 family)
MDGWDVASCLVITSLKGAAEKSTDITQEARDLLLDVYGKLATGEMKLPLEQDYTVRELVDISWKQKACVEAPHTHAVDLDKDGTRVTVSFELGVGSTDELMVFAYRNGQWSAVESVEIGEDGKVTCVFEHFCPVAFCVKNEKDIDPTGDISVDGLVLWGLLLAVSCAAVVVMSVKRRAFLR